LKMVPAGNVPTGSTLIPLLNQPTGTAIDFFYGADNSGIDVIATASATPLTVQQTTSLCPLKTIQLAALQANPTQTFTPLHIDLQKGTFHPIGFFISPDTTQVYIVTTDQGILDYNFSTQAVTAIPLLNDAAPVAADMSADGTLMYVAGTDGMLHQVNLNLAADQPSPIFFSELANSTNNFCYQDYSCTLDLVAVKP
jgi:DNA-binding beta-propeller fold protein YncE